jgi:hypothetical protein
MTLKHYRLTSYQPHDIDVVLKPGIRSGYMQISKLSVASNITHCLKQTNYLMRCRKTAITEGKVVCQVNPVNLFQWSSDS